MFVDFSTNCFPRSWNPGSFRRQARKRPRWPLLRRATHPLTLPPNHSQQTLPTHPAPSESQTFGLGPNLNSW